MQLKFLRTIIYKIKNIIFKTSDKTYTKQTLTCITLEVIRVPCLIRCVLFPATAIRCLCISNDGYNR